MSKPQATPEVLRSITASLLATLGPLTMATVGCLSPNGGEMTSSVQLSSETAGPGTGSSEGEGSTRGDIMTTTEGVDTTAPAHSESGDTSGSESSGSDTTGSPGCGDGLVQDGEECDLGKAMNADDGACTSQCKLATCGDKLVQKGVEACDDGQNDGAYGGCAEDCSALAPYCGDGQVQPAYESCDEVDPHGGCVPSTCKFAVSCKEIREGAPDDPEVVDGVYSIKPQDTMLTVLCDMDADGGGYTFLKVSLPDPGAKVTAAQAESKCKTYGMQLLVPRSKAHAAAAVAMAKSVSLVPVGGGAKKSGLDYMSLLGIYPVNENKSCTGKRFNDVDCPEWKATGKTYWVTDMVDPGLPGTNNCLKCSNLYTWKDDGTLDYYETFYNNGVGAETYRYMCDVGDKLP